MVCARHPVLVLEYLRDVLLIKRVVKHQSTYKYNRISDNVKSWIKVNITTYNKIAPNRGNVKYVSHPPEPRIYKLL